MLLWLCFVRHIVLLPVLQIFTAPRPNLQLAEAFWERAAGIITDTQPKQGVGRRALTAFRLQSPEGDRSLPNALAIPPGGTLLW